MGLDRMPTITPICGLNYGSEQLSSENSGGGGDESLMWRTMSISSLDLVRELVWRWDALEQEADCENKATCMVQEIMPTKSRTRRERIEGL